MGDASPKMHGPVAVKSIGRVPPVDPLFWFIQLLALIAGATCADALIATFPAPVVVSGTACLAGGALALKLMQRRYRKPYYWLTLLLVSVAAHALAQSVITAPQALTMLPVAIAAILFVGSLVLSRFVAGTISFFTVDTRDNERAIWVVTAFLVLFGALLGQSLVNRYSPENPLLSAAFAVPFIIISLSQLATTRRIATFWTLYLLLSPLGVILGTLMMQSELLRETTWKAWPSAIVALSVYALGILYLIGTRDGAHASRLSKKSSL